MGDSSDVTRAFVRIPPRDSNDSGYTRSKMTGSSSAWSMPPAPKLVPRICACPGCCRMGATIAVGSCPTLCADCISMLQPKYYYKVNQHGVPVENEAAQTSSAPMSGPSIQHVAHTDHAYGAPQGYHYVANQKSGASMYFIKRDLEASSGNVSDRMPRMPSEEHLPFGPSTGGQSSSYRAVYPPGAITGSNPYYTAQVYDDMRLWPPQPAACGPRMGPPYQYQSPTNSMHNPPQDHMMM